ncbi:HAD family phosphatase [Candidatus Pacearchaeota archaeon]|nr:HAD family phosphatase [Candidatus Pacearchaeota archaeon]
MKKREIKAILFDIGGVLFLPKKPVKKSKTPGSGVHYSISKKLGISVDQWFDSIENFYSDSVKGKISENRVLEKLSENNQLPKNKIKKLIISVYKNKFQENKELYEQAKKLKKQGYKIGILSDQWHLSKKAIVPQRYYNFFNPLIISCDVGTRKPETQIFNLALEKLKLNPKEVLFIDNQKWNIKAAKKLGIQTILFKNNKQTIKKLNKLFKKI